MRMVSTPLGRDVRIGTLLGNEGEEAVALGQLIWPYGGAEAFHARGGVNPCARRRPSYRGADQKRAGEVGGNAEILPSRGSHASRCVVGLPGVLRKEIFTARVADCAGRACTAGG